MMALLRPQHVGGTLQSDKLLFVVVCAIAGLNGTFISLHHISKTSNCNLHSMTII